MDAAVIRAVRPNPPDSDGIEFEHALESIDELVAGSFGHKFRDTLATLAALRRRGAFVTTTQSNSCQYCDFRNACRRLHPPSAHRVRTCAIPEAVDYLGLTDKSFRTRHSANGSDE